MAAREYIWMRSQREAYEHEISLESEELRDDPEAELEELAMIYRAEGLEAEEAHRLVAIASAGTALFGVGTGV